MFKNLFGIDNPFDFDGFIGNIERRIEENGGKKVTDSNGRLLGYVFGYDVNDGLRRIDMNDYEIEVKPKKNTYIMDDIDTFDGLIPKEKEPVVEEEDKSLNEIRKRFNVRGFEDGEIDVFTDGNVIRISMVHKEENGQMSAFYEESIPKDTDVRLIGISREGDELVVVLPQHKIESDDKWLKLDW